jgi:hypothetical protein
VASALKRISKQGGPSCKLAQPLQQKTAATSGKPQITVDPRDLDKGFLEARRQTLRALRVYNKRPRLFQRAGALVRIVTRDECKLIDELSVPSLNGMMIEAADYGTVVHTKKMTTTKWDMPHERHVQDVLCLGGWPVKAIPALRCVAPAPRFASTGRLVIKRGFDRESGIYLSPPDGFQLPTVPDTPTDADVRWAKDFIFKELYVDFPFVKLEKHQQTDERADDSVFYHNPSRCHILAFMLQPFLMEFIDDEPTPLYVSEAPTQGTGKTRILRFATLPSQGCLASTLAPPETEEEWQKAILTRLRGGAEYTLFDNLASHLKSPSFANVLTTSRFEGRLLHTNTDGKYPNRTAWAISVNNGSFSPDIGRRTVLIRLDAGLAAPDQRDPGRFKHSNLTEWALQNRHELLRACLILCRHWIVAGMPRVNVRFDYPQWAGIMGGLLETIGMRGFLENRSQIYSDDDVKWVKLIQAWLKKIDDENGQLTNPMTTNDVYDLIKESRTLPVEFASLGRNTDSDEQRKRRLRSWLVAIRDKVYVVQREGVVRHIRLRVDSQWQYRYWLEEMLNEAGQASEAYK